MTILLRVAAIPTVLVALASGCMTIGNPEDPQCFRLPAVVTIYCEDEPAHPEAREEDGD